MKVREVMRPLSVRLDGGTPLDEARTRLTETREAVGAVVQDGEILALVTAGDLHERDAHEERASSCVPLRERIPAGRYFYCMEDEDADTVASRMRARSIAHVVVATTAGKAAGVFVIDTKTH